MSEQASRRALLVAAVAHPAWLLGAWLTGDGPVWVPMGVTALLVGAATVWVSPSETVARLALRRGPVVLGVVAGAALAGASHALWPPIAEAAPALVPEVEQLYVKLGRGPDPIMTLPVLAGIVLAEELLWRGLVQGVAEPKIGAPLAGALTTVVYGLAQAGQGSAVLVVVALLVGAVFSTLRALTRELWAPLLCHLVWNLFVLVLVPLKG